MRLKIDTSEMPQSKCAFCGLRFCIDEKNFAVIHDEPICQKFLELDILDFLKENREIKQARNN